MGKVSEKEKVEKADAAEEAAVLALEASSNRSFRTVQIIPVLEALASQFSNLQPPHFAWDWTFFGPPDALLKFMVEKRSGVTDGLPLNGADLLAFLQDHAVARKIRQDGKIRVSIEPSPRAKRGEQALMIRVEKIAVAADQVLTG